MTTEDDDAPPGSGGVFCDLDRFVLRRSGVPTLIMAQDPETREDYVQRIRQRLGIGVEDYAVLNVHRIEIEAPVRLVFEELFNWNGTSVWWPNRLASVDRVNGGLDHIRVRLFGLPGTCFVLFDMHAIRIQQHPGPGDVDNARYALYRTSGGYPVGMFGMYVRSRIRELGEKERAQLFFAVGFDFYGKKDWPHRHVTNPAWEWVHNRVTAHVLNRLKRICERRFRQVRAGG
jgi:hypothetical protein